MIPEHGCMSLKRYKGLDKDWLNRRPEPGFRLRKAANMLFVIFCIHKATLYIIELLLAQGSNSAIQVSVRVNAHKRFKKLSPSYDSVCNTQRHPAVPFERQ